MLAREASADLKFIYAHFMHTPSSVALYASIMRGVEWGFSAHAKDIWMSPDWEKRDKLGRADFRRHLHRARRRASAQPVRRSGQARSGLSRPRPVALSASASPATATRRIWRSRRRHLGWPAGREERLQPASRCAGQAARHVEMALHPYRRRRSFCKHSRRGLKSSGFPSASNGAAHAIRARSSQRCARQTSSCCLPGSPATATATACPTS